MSFPRIAALKTAEEFQDHLRSSGISLPFDAALETGAQSPLAQPLRRKSGAIGNRFCILPMEGWDGTTDGRPSELTCRRWRNFGLSGAKLIWGGEAVAVREDGRANPHQLLMNASTVGDTARLREILIETHQQQFGSTSDLVVGLQLTHSGRFARPHGKQLEPRIVYRHPLLDERFGVRDAAALLTDDEIDRLIEDFVKAARLARDAGFDFVDVKHCHGYLGHEFLSAVDRPGKYGGSFENRTRYLRAIVSGVRAEAPGLEIGVRVSIYDFVPFQPGSSGVGVPASIPGPYRYAFGGDGTGLGIDLAEPRMFLALLESLGIDLVCSTAGSPYYNPHLMRPAAFPPSDGYLPPEDPLAGVARQIEAAAHLKALFPNMIIVGSGYSYLQEWLPHVGQRVIRENKADFIGLGRMVLTYPELPADVLAGRPLARKRLCRTFSDCTTAPRNGMVSGCYPLDPFYKGRPERDAVNAIKSRWKDAHEH
ncbi:MAG TPA: NADH:flavin oxidoreductase [Planctomycetaceae bacterium]|jgi:2,4-dienoyl-CoA reductase-like NADH-dependent reductase (Old Yellow Enzyme family)